MRLRVDLHCRGAYVDAYAEHALPLRVESFAFSAVTQNGDRRMAAAVPVFGLMVIVALGYFAASPVESLWKFE